MADAPACDPFPPITKNMLIFHSCKKCQKKNAHFQSIEEISQTCMPVQRCLMKLLLIFNTKENNEKKDWTKWKLSILERCRRACVCGFWFCDRKFVHDVIQRWTASWNTQKAAPNHIDALHNLAAQLIPTEARNYSFTLQEKKSSKNFQIHTTANQLRIHFSIPEERDIPLWEDTFCQQSPGSHTGDPKSPSHRKLPMRIQSAKLHMTESQLITIRSL